MFACRRPTVIRRFGSRKNQLSYRFLAVLIASLLAAAPVAAESPLAQSLTAMRGFDQRVTTIGFRLAAASDGWCADPAWLPGLELHEITQYGADWRAAAVEAFGLDDDPAVLALAANGPAAGAGLQLDDHVTSIDGAPLPGAAGVAQGSFDRGARILDALDAAFADGHASLAVRRGDRTLAIEVAAVRGCPTRFQLIPAARLNALADGQYVQITTALADYVADDDELAAVLAHEFAHNLLHHRARLDAAHISRGLLGNFGRNARLIRETEDDADRLSVYLMARAGYDPQAAVRFWTRFGRRGLSFLSAPTHSNWRQRIALFEAEIAKIRAAAIAGRPPDPDFVHLPLPSGG